MRKSVKNSLRKLSVQTVVIEIKIHVQAWETKKCKAEALWGFWIKLVMGLLCAVMCSVCMRVCVCKEVISFGLM